ncbi:mucin-associated surface protein (MASP), partial [Trypanosoma cruzi]
FLLLVCRSVCVPLQGCCRCLLCVLLCDLFFLSISLCVDVLLFCAEGHTQVTGVMAMMMTGRVLLVCALCVLWCGAGGRCDEEKRAGLGSGPEALPESQGLEASLQVKQDLSREAGGVKEKVPSTSPENEVEDDEDDEDEEEVIEENDEGAEAEGGEKTRSEGQGDQEVTIALHQNSGEKNLSGSEQRTHQSIVSEGEIPPPGSRESKAIPTQTEVEEKKETDKSAPAAENTPTPVNGENTLPAGVPG